MSELQVLVASMHQRDMSLAEKMNIRCDAVLANQADAEEIYMKQTSWGTVKMITTATRGVGLNRNIALLAADADYLLFADDDMVYKDDMPETVVSAFRENPDADILIFGIDILKDGKITERRQLKKGRLHLWNSMRFGMVRIAARRNAVIAGNITFHQCFGGGCAFSAGEDSLFLKACFDSGLHVYSHDYVLGTCCKDTSSWFTGCDEKYFYDKGVLMRLLFPKNPYLMALYFGIRHKRQTDIQVLKRVRLMFEGVNGGKNLRPYHDRNEENNYCQ